MANSVTELSIAQFRNAPSLVQRTINDLGLLFERLLRHDIDVARMYQPVRYEATEAKTCLLEGLITLIMSSSVHASLPVRAQLFRVLTKYKIRGDEDFLNQMRSYALANRISAALPSDDEMRGVYNRGLELRANAGIAGPFTPPRIIWLPLAVSAAFSGAHGVSAMGLDPSACALLCPTQYYAQILWHEMLHLLFACSDCYRADLGRTCNLPSCVMQYEACYAPTTGESWLCDEQVRHIRAWHTSLTR